jgi:hypothetical protein
VPPTGFLWVDTSTTVTSPPAAAYFPPQTPPASGFNTFTDSAGEVWVSYNGSAWKKARDVCRTRAYNNAAITWAPGTTNVVYTSLDANTGDVLGSMNIATGVYTVPVTGVYQIDARVYAAASAAPAGSLFAGLNLLKNGAEVARGSGTGSNMSGVIMQSTVSDQVHCVAGDTLQTQFNNVMAINLTCPAGYVQLNTFSVHLVSPG